MEQPENDRAEMYEEMKRGQSDYEDWLPNDCDFWQPFSTEGDDEDSGD